MPYKDKDRQKEYQNTWMQKRRIKWLEENGPCKKCGSWNDLQVDHVDPDKKVTHRVWSWSKERRDKELAKCQSLCCKCHKQKTKDQVEAICGTTSKWRAGCRCAMCREAHRAYMESWRQR